jgi:hypothetical protein
MKWLIFCCLGVVLFTCETAASLKEKVSNIPAVASDSTAVNFKKDIAPILVKRCSPCHFTGGTMYGRMPFDKDTTILHHTGGVLKRIIDEKEKGLLERFIQQNKIP